VALQETINSSDSQLNLCSCDMSCNYSYYISWVRKT